MNLILSSLAARSTLGFDAWGMLGGWEEIDFVYMFVDRMSS